jgi:hypothetical protein
MSKSGTRIITCIIQTKDILLGLLNTEDVGTTSIRNVGIRYSEERRPHNHVSYFLQNYVNVKNFP